MIPLEKSLRKRPYARVEEDLRVATAKGDATRAAACSAELDRRKTPRRTPTPLTPMAPIPAAIDPAVEQWLPVPVSAFAELYEVSSFGRVRRYGSKPLDIKERRNERYLMVSLYRPKKDGGPVTWRLHRLVAGAFVANPDALPEVNHKDSDRLNNHAANLEWVTRIENIAHSIEAGRNTARTNPNKVRKLSPADVDAIRSAYGAESAATLAERFGVRTRTIYRVVGRQTQLAPHEMRTATVTAKQDDA